MKKLLTFLLLLIIIIPDYAAAQYNYFDIGNTRLIDSAGVFIIRSKPFKTLGKMRILKQSSFEDTTSFNPTISDNYLKTTILSTSNVDTSKINYLDQEDTITAKKTYTANQDFNGLVKLGSDALYIKLKIVKFAVITNTWIYTAHGLNWKNILFISGVIRHDTTSSFYYDKQVFNAGYNATAIYNTGFIFKADSLNVGYWISSASSGIVGDSAIITIFYTNMY